MDEISLMKRKLIKNGIDQLMSVETDNVKTIIRNVSNYNKSDNKGKNAVIERVKCILIEGTEIYDKSFKRLRNEAAVNYYKHFITASRRENLSGQIEAQLVYFRKQKMKKNYYMYIGQGFGECRGPYEQDNLMGNVYIDLRTKTDEELVNLLVVKTKIEQDFISYQYLRAVSFLYDIEIIDKNEFEMEIYGTRDEKKIALLKLGITAGLLKILSENGQTSNIEKDNFGNIIANPTLVEFYNRSNDYTKFELHKYIKLE